MTIAMMMTETVAPVAAGAVEQPPVIRTNSISRALTPSCNDTYYEQIDDDDDGGGDTGGYRDDDKGALIHFSVADAHRSY